MQNRDCVRFIAVFSREFDKVPKQFLSMPLFLKEIAAKPRL